MNTSRLAFASVVLGLLGAAVHFGVFTPPMAHAAASPASAAQPAAPKTQSACDMARQAINEWNSRQVNDALGCR